LVHAEIFVLLDKIGKALHYGAGRPVETLQ